MTAAPQPTQLFRGTLRGGRAARASVCPASRTSQGLEAAEHGGFSPYLPAGLGRDLKRCLECPPLLRGQDRPGSLGPLVILPILSALPRGLAHFADAVLIITFA